MLTRKLVASHERSELRRIQQHQSVTAPRIFFIRTRSDTNSNEITPSWVFQTLLRYWVNSGRERRPKSDGLVLKSRRHFSDLTHPPSRTLTALRRNGTQRQVQVLLTEERVWWQSQNQSPARVRAAYSGKWLVNHSEYLYLFVDNRSCRVRSTSRWIRSLNTIQCSFKQ